MCLCAVGRVIARWSWSQAVRSMTGFPRRSMRQCRGRVLTSYTSTECRTSHCGSSISCTYTHTHTDVQRPFVRVKPVWILLKQETVSGSGISWAMCKSEPRSRQITMPAPHRSVFYRPDALPAAQPTASKH